MAAVVRQPFAPLDGARLQSLISIKNAQNCESNSYNSSFYFRLGPVVGTSVDGARDPPTSRVVPTNPRPAIPVSSPSKRKAADLLDVDDFENVDPALLFSKRSKSSSDGLDKDFFKSPTYILTKSSSTPAISSKDDLSNTSYSSPIKATASRPRSILNPKSPTKKLNSSLSKAASPKSAPAGRSPTRGNNRVGILNRRRTGTFARVDPPSFNRLSAPFSLDAALKGTVPSYAPRASASRAASSRGSSGKASWFFDIHEDTPEQEMTNLLQHNTGRLDISSDEECEQKLRRERVDGRGKENIPPADDVSQTRVRRTTTITSEGGMEYEKPRTALGDLNVEEFYADGVDSAEVIIVPADEEDGTLVDGEQDQNSEEEPSDRPECELGNEVKLGIETVEEEADESEFSTGPVQLAKLQPVEGTGENFELWESSSAREEADGARSPSPMPASPASTTGEDFDDTEN